MTDKTFSRREFLIAGGAVLGAAALVSAGAGCTSQTSGISGGKGNSGNNAVETPSYHYGVAESGSRVLVAYATRTGSTVGVAAAIGETLGKRGFSVDVSPMKDNQDMDGYGTVLLGSAINGGQWLPEAVS